MKTMAVFLLSMACASLICTAGQAQTQFTFVPVGHTNDGGTAVAVVVSGHYCFLANREDGLRIYDVSNPANPINIAHTNDGGHAIGLAVSSNYLYLVNHLDGLRIYDISDPANPINVGHSTNDTASVPFCTPLYNAVAVSDHYAYISDASRGMWVCDVSDPTNPVVVCQKAGTNGGFLYSSLDLAVAGTNVYVTCLLDGLRIYDTSNPSNPTEIGHAALYARALTVEGSYVYVTVPNEGFRIYDVSDPSNPINVGGASTGLTNDDRILTVRVAGNYAFVGDLNGLHVYDIRDKTHPVEVGSVNGLFTEGVALSGNYVYLATAWSGLQVYFLMPLLRITNTATNTLVLSWPITSSSFAVQENSDLSTSNWVTLTNQPMAIAGQAELVLASPTRPTFYRLKQLP